MSWQTFILQNCIGMSSLIRTIASARTILMPTVQLAAKLSENYR